MALFFNLLRPRHIFIRANILAFHRTMGGLLGFAYAMCTHAKYSRCSSFIDVRIRVISMIWLAKPSVLLLPGTTRQGLPLHRLVL